MADLNKKEELKTPEKNPATGEGSSRLEQETGRMPEKKDYSQYDKVVSAQLREELSKMQLDDDAKKEVEKKAQKIEYLGEKEKIEHLLEMARTKGVFFAIQVARKMNEPYLLDILHDTLAQEGLYKKMTPSDDDNKK